MHIVSLVVVKNQLNMQNIQKIFAGGKFVVAFLHLYCVPQVAQVSNC